MLLRMPRWQKYRGRCQRFLGEGGESTPEAHHSLTYLASGHKRIHHDPQDHSDARHIGVNDDVLGGQADEAHRDEQFDADAEARQPLDDYRFDFGYHFGRSIFDHLHIQRCYPVFPPVVGRWSPTPQALALDDFAPDPGIACGQCSE